jgi:hypothetical protein
MNFRYKKPLFCLFLLICVISGLVLLANCKRTENTQAYFSYPFSIDNTGNAVILSVANDSSDIKKLYYVHIPDLKVLAFEGIKKVFGGGWIPLRNQPFVVVVGKEKDNFFSLKIFQYDGNMLKEVKTILFPNMFVTFPIWNPAGNILAARVNLIINGNVQEAKLGLSFDDGNNLDVTEWKFGMVAWEATDKLWMNSGNKLLELSIKGGKAHLENEIAFSENDYPSLIGVNGEEPVYGLGNKIYRGNTVLYSGSGNCTDTMVDDQLILVWEQDLKRIVILDCSGTIIHTRLLDEGVRPAGFSSKSKKIFLYENLRILSMYDFETDGPIQRLVDINSFH